jgi:hypothetical protein
MPSQLSSVGLLLLQLVALFVLLLVLASRVQW